jgi:hypothetical protein
MSYFDIENSTLDNKLDYQFQKQFLEKNSGNGVTLSKISEIDPSIPVLYNSVNVFVGRRPSGKTYTCIKEL